MEPAVTVREARGREDYDACVALQREVWGLSDLEITSAIQLIATVHAGGLLLVAEAAGEGIVGFSYGFAAWSDGTPHLHSDMLAVLPAWRGRGVGLRLKWAQREAVLARGPAARHLDLRPDAREERAAEPAPPRRDLARAPAGPLRPHQLGAAPRPRDRPPARPLGAPSQRVRRLAAGRAAKASRARAARLNDVRLQGGQPVSSDPAPRPRRPAAAARGPVGLGRGLPRRRGARARVAGHRAPLVRVGLRARLRGGRRRDDPGRPERRLCPGAAHSGPVAAGSSGSEDHSLQDPA